MLVGILESLARDVKGVPPTVEEVAATTSLRERLTLESRAEWETVVRRELPAGAGNGFPLPIPTAPLQPPPPPPLYPPSSLRAICSLRI